MRNIILFLLLLPLMAYGQTYKHIGVEDGLSNRRIYNIQKDHQGYMWFLTNEGMDRYNGKDIKHYKLIEENKQLSSEYISDGYMLIKKAGYGSLEKKDVFSSMKKSMIVLQWSISHRKSLMPSVTVIWTVTTIYGYAAKILFCCIILRLLRLCGFLICWKIILR